MSKSHYFHFLCNNVFPMSLFKTKVKGRKIGNNAKPVEEEDN